MSGSMNMSIGKNIGVLKKIKALFCHSGENRSPACLWNHKRKGFRPSSLCHTKVNVILRSCRPPQQPATEDGRRRRIPECYTLIAAGWTHEVCPPCVLNARSFASLRMTNILLIATQPLRRNDVLTIQRYSSAGLMRENSSASAMKKAGIVAKPARARLPRHRGGNRIGKARSGPALGCAYAFLFRSQACQGTCKVFAQP
jgi:hypothetical protein